MRLLLALAVLPFAAGAAGAEVALAAREEPFRFSVGEQVRPTIVVLLPTEPVTVRLQNLGATGHNWQIDGLAAIPFPVHPGQDGTVTFSPPGAGSWRYFCLAHEAQGMHGELRVEERGIPLLPLAAVAALAVAARVTVAKP